MLFTVAIFAFNSRLASTSMMNTYASATCKKALRTADGDDGTKLVRATAAVGAAEGPVCRARRCAHLPSDAMRNSGSRISRRGNKKYAKLKGFALLGLVSVSNANAHVVSR